MSMTLTDDAALNTRLLDTYPALDDPDPRKRPGWYAGLPTTIDWASLPPALVARRNDYLRDWMRLCDVGHTEWRMTCNLEPWAHQTHDTREAAIDERLRLGPLVREALQDLHDALRAAGVILASVPVTRARKPRVTPVPAPVAVVEAVRLVIERCRLCGGEDGQHEASCLLSPEGRRKRIEQVMQGRLM